MLTEPMIQKWLPLKENKAIYSWGEVAVTFNYHGGLATSLSFTWKDSRDAAAKQKAQDDAARAWQAVVPDPPTLENFRRKIDNLIDNARYDEALKKMYIALCWLENPPTKEVRDALRPRLVRLKQEENKSKIAKYLSEAPFGQIAIFLHGIQSGAKTEFLTPEEYSTGNYYLKGCMNKDYVGNCEISGGRYFERVNIRGKTDATKKLFAALNIEVPFDYQNTYLKIAPPPGPLIDDVLDQQRERAAKIYEQRSQASNGLPDSNLNANSNGLPSPPEPSSVDNQ
ncbi:hypothetical protein BH11CYA1_BH11CYA1_03890 [soil metagenome]